MDTGKDTDRDILLKAFETTRAWSALLVTLATGGIVFTAIFRRDFAPKYGDIQASDVLLATWIVLGVSALSGVFLLGTLTAILNKGDKDELDVYQSTGWFFALVQLVTFVAGLGLLLAFAAINLG